MDQGSGCCLCDPVGQLLLRADVVGDVLRPLIVGLGLQCPVCQEREQARLGLHGVAGAGVDMRAASPGLLRARVAVSSVQLYRALETSLDQAR
jgi:hypothetical protein